MPPTDLAFALHRIPASRVRELLGTPATRYHAVTEPPPRDPSVKQGVPWLPTASEARRARAVLNTLAARTPENEKARIAAMEWLSQVAEAREAKRPIPSKKSIRDLIGPDTANRVSVWLCRAREGMGARR